MHADLLALLLPPISYDPAGVAIRAELSVEGAALDAAQRRAAEVANGVTPLFARDLLPEWERVCGVAPAAGAGYQQRVQAVVAKLAETGGLSRPYFIRLAAGLGYQISIDEPQPFRAGFNRAGDRLNVHDVIWVWRVTVLSGAGRAYRFRAGFSAAGERLTTFGEQVIEAVFNDLKPAHTFCHFIYMES
ncbi:YmfQ family protein [Chitiniphilus eburneus]|uniref:YmfQ family protein n=1 Tax=Chitiniphilus eburneus TaxID=2571148 RepID=UPI0035D0EB3D